MLNGYAPILQLFSWRSVHVIFSTFFSFAVILTDGELKQLLLLWLLSLSTSILLLLRTLWPFTINVCMYHCWQLSSFLLLVLFFRKFALLGMFTSFSHFVVKYSTLRDISVKIFKVFEIVWIVFLLQSFSTNFHCLEEIATEIQQFFSCY